MTDTTATPQTLKGVSFSDLASSQPPNQLKKPDATAGTEEPTKVEVSGLVKRLFTNNDKFSAGILELDNGGEVRFAGPVAVSEGAWVRLIGVEVHDDKWGKQVRVSAWAYAGFSTPTDDGSAPVGIPAESLARYLATCKELKGIGPAKARKLAETFCLTWEHSLQNETLRMSAVAGVPEETIHILAGLWRSRAAHNELSVWLAGFGLTEYQVSAIVDEYAARFGPGTKAALLENPYRMIGELDGFGFGRVDQIALKMGVEKNASIRIQASLGFCLQQQEQGAGHTWTGRADLIHAAYDALALDDEDWRERVEAEIAAMVTADTIGHRDSGSKLGTARLLRQEESVGGQLREVGRHWKGFAVPDGVLSGLTDEQADAVRMVCNDGGLVITGAAGCGKTHGIGAIVKAFRAADKHDIVLCAPTGKASRRMVEALAELGIKVDAKTIHRALGYVPPGTWTRGPECPLDADLVICDESSMTDIPLFYRLISAVNTERTAFVLVGDPEQLPPVGPGAPLRDILQQKIMPIQRLTQVIRQAGILKQNCNAVLDGVVAAGMPWPQVTDVTESTLPTVPAWAVISAQKHREADELRGTIERLYATQLLAMRLPGRNGEVDGGQGNNKAIDIVRDVQLITPVHKGPLGTVELNILLQRVIQRERYGIETPELKPGKRPAFLAGDRVIQTRNNYKIGPSGLMNGTIGVVLRIGTKYDGIGGLSDGDLLVEFDGEDEPIKIPKKGGAQSDIALAYALTVHKLQGSQCPVTVIVVSKSHAYTAHRGLFYTAVTRSQRSCIVVADPWALKNAVDTVVTDDRRTLLSLKGKY